MAATVRVDRSARGETRVRIEAPVAWPPFRRRGQGFRITTTPLALRTDHFPEATARRGVAHSKEKKRGRALYCQQLRDPQTSQPGVPQRGQVVAALSWHVDERARAPILITNLAIRGDSEEARALSRAAAGWMIAYLLEVARQDHRALEIGVEIDTQPNADDFAAIGFRPAAAPDAYRAPYWAFVAPPGAPAR